MWTARDAHLTVNSFATKGRWKLEVRLVCCYSEAGHRPPGTYRFAHQISMDKRANGD